MSAGRWHPVRPGNTGNPVTTSSIVSAHNPVSGRCLANSVPTNLPEGPSFFRPSGIMYSLDPAPGGPHQPREPQARQTI
jgi:hypothetical protein